MNSRRAVTWMVFLGLSGALAWAPGHWFGQPEPELARARPSAAGGAQLAASSEAASGSKASTPSRDLFPSQQWSAPVTLTTVIEQPVAHTPVPLVPTAPALPFQFVGRLDDRNDLQVFLQNGEKLYVVRQGDVIEDTYRLDHVSATELGLVYLPLHQLQTLSVGSAP